MGARNTWNLSIDHSYVQQIICIFLCHDPVVLLSLTWIFKDTDDTIICIKYNRHLSWLIPEGLGSDSEFVEVSSISHCSYEVSNHMKYQIKSVVVENQLSYFGRIHMDQNISGLSFLKYCNPESTWKMLNFFSCQSCYLVKTSSCNPGLNNEVFSELNGSLRPAQPWLIKLVRIRPTKPFMLCAQFELKIT